MTEEMICDGDGEANCVCRDDQILTSDLGTGDLPRITVVLVSHQSKMDNEDQDLLDAIRRYEMQDYAGPHDLNLVLDPLNGEDDSYTPEMLQAVGVGKADHGIVVFWSDTSKYLEDNLSTLAQVFVEAWPENTIIKDTGSRLVACTKGHYMREIFESVMTS